MARQGNRIIDLLDGAIPGRVVGIGVALEDLRRRIRALLHRRRQLIRGVVAVLPEDEVRSRDSNDDARTLGRGPGCNSRRSDSDVDRCDRSHDPRWLERDRETRDRDPDVRDVFTRDLNLPRGLEREVVFHRGREYTLRGSESRTLASVGAFRVVSSRDLVDHRNRPADPRSGDHLREQGLIEIVRMPGHREPAVVLTKEGRGLLDGHRDRDQGHRQTFYAGLKREREVEHDTHVYRAYIREAERLEERGARIDRVLLDYELKREYQQWLHARDRDRDDYAGRPDRSPDEIEDWARKHDLPYFDDEVHFPDLRIEYQEPDGGWEHEDIEVTTPHYRGAHGASVARSGFVRFGTSSVRIGGSGRAPDPHLAEEFFR
jgi:hypothetical protein